MKAQKWTYCLDTLVSVENISVPDTYDENQYGDTLGFSVGSNQLIITDKDLFKREVK